MSRHVCTGGVTVLMVLLVHCLTSSSATEFETRLPASGNGTRLFSHVVDLNVTSETSMERVNGTAFVWLNVSVPLIDETKTSFCPSFYLIDIADPLTSNNSLTYFADTDALGRARSPCSALDYTYDSSTFATDVLGRYGSVRPGWNVTFPPNRANYHTAVPILLETIVSSCGGTSSLEQRDGLHGNSETRRYEFGINVCQVGYYGLQCDGSDNSYAAACVESRVVVLESPMNVSSVSGIMGTSRPFEGELLFSQFNTTEAGGCFLGRTRGLLIFEIIASGFDPLLDVRLMNPPDSALGGLATPTVSSILDGPGDALRMGTFVHNGGETAGRPGMSTWIVTVVTPFIAYDSDRAFVEYFGNVFNPGSFMTRMRFGATFQNGHYLMLNIILDGSLLLDATPANGTCVVPPPSPRPPPFPPQPEFPIAPPDTTGAATNRTRWPWAIPTGMTVTVVVSAGFALFPVPW